MLSLEKVTQVEQPELALIVTLFPFFLRAVLQYTFSLSLKTESAETHVLLFKSTEQRIDDINFWKSELDKKLLDCKAEIDMLLSYQTRLENALEACKEPLEIVNRCLQMRFVLTHSRWGTKPKSLKKKTKFKVASPSLCLVNYLIKELIYY